MKENGALYPYGLATTLVDEYSCKYLIFFFLEQGWGPHLNERCGKV